MAMEEWSGQVQFPVEQVGTRLSRETLVNKPLYTAAFIDKSADCKSAVSNTKSAIIKY